MAFEDILDYGVGGWGAYEHQDEISKYLSERIDIDLAEPYYSFDYVSFWVRKDTGQILYSTDSGCSCPTPYEETKVSELKEISFSGIPALLDRLADEGYGYSASAIRKDARNNLYPSLIEYGANID